MKHSAPPIDVFISYKREDRETAKALAEALAHRGYSVWWDVDLLPGDRFSDTIMEVIKQAKATVVLWSKASVASGFVRAEATAADGLARLIPARLDACELPLPFNVLHTHDLTNWRAGTDETLLAPLFKAVAGRTGKAPTPPQQPAAAAENLHRQDGETLLWRALTEQAAASPKEYELFLAKYPDGIFADLARIRLEAFADGREAPLPSGAHKIHGPGPLSKLALLTKQTFLGRLVAPIAGATFLILVSNLPHAPIAPEAALTIAFPMALLLGTVIGALHTAHVLVLYIGLVYFEIVAKYPLHTFELYDTLEILLSNYLAGGIVVGYLAERGWCRTIPSSLAAFAIGASVALLLPAVMLSTYSPSSRFPVQPVLPTVILPSAVLIIALAYAIGWMNSRKST